MIQPHVFDGWLADLRSREPRALELAYALELTLPQQGEGAVLRAQIAPDIDAAKIISADVRDLMQLAHERYDAFRDGTFKIIELGNANVFAFERVWDGEQLLIVNNLARVPQPVKFRVYAGGAGWDILNRVEFVFPPRAQLEPYEFLWLMLVPNSAD